MTYQTYETPLKFVKCIECKRETSEGHSEHLFEDVWVCSWCCCGVE